MSASPTFPTEAALCAAFMAAIESPWIAYPETAEWDILLVNRIDHRQIGVQAKLKLNAKVMAQSVEAYSWDHNGPDYRAVLVPSTQNNELTTLAPHCGITIIKMSMGFSLGSSRFYPSLPRESPHSVSDDWHERLPTKRHQVPEFIPDVEAGIASPTKLTNWKIAALKLAVLLDQTGYLTRDDFKRLGVDIRRWIGAERWLKPSDQGFVAAERCPRFQIQHPRVWDEIKADPAKWQRRQQLFLGAKL